jgi:hypothetical protein
LETLPCRKAESEGATQMTFLKDYGYFISDFGLVHSGCRQVSLSEICYYLFPVFVLGLCLYLSQRTIGAEVKNRDLCRLFEDAYSRICKLRGGYNENPLDTDADLIRRYEQLRRERDISR